MIGLAYTINGVEDIQRLFASLRADALKDTLADLMDKIAGDAADYPPEIPDSTYVRSGDLGRGWTEGRTLYPQSGVTVLEAVRENSVAYGPLVMGIDDQAKVHRERWRTTDAIMDAWEDRVAAGVEAELDRILNR